MPGGDKETNRYTDAVVSTIKENLKLLWDHIRPKSCNTAYNYYPRGRVEIDPKGRPVIYMSPHIGSDHIPKIMEAFSLQGEPRVIIDGSRHYRSHLDSRQ